MRRKSDVVLPFAWNNHRLLKNVLDWREKYKRISRILDDQGLPLGTIGRS
jgi:hypothetical protein